MVLKKFIPVVQVFLSNLAKTKKTNQDKNVDFFFLFFFSRSCIFTPIPASPCADFKYSLNYCAICRFTTKLNNLFSYQEKKGKKKSTKKINTPVFLKKGYLF